jgi:hypothetical protein
MWDMVKNWAKEKGELEDNVVNFVRKKFEMPCNPLLQLCFQLVQLQTKLKTTHVVATCVLQLGNIFCNC